MKKKKSANKDNKRNPFVYDGDSRCVWGVFGCVGAMGCVRWVCVWGCVMGVRVYDGVCIVCVG